MLHRVQKRGEKLTGPAGKRCQSGKDRQRAILEPGRTKTGYGSASNEHSRRLGDAADERAQLKHAKADEKHPLAH